jgi:hypothetical protein
LEEYKLYGVEQITAELISQGEKKIYSEICNLIKFLWNKEVLPEQCPLQFSLLLFIE